MAGHHVYRLSPIKIQQLHTDSYKCVLSHFDKDKKDKFTKTEASGIHQTLTLSTTVVNDALSKINMRKVAGPDDILGRVFSACAEQLVGVFTDILKPIPCQDSCTETQTLLSNVPERLLPCSTHSHCDEVL